MDIFQQSRDSTAINQEIDGLQKYITRLKVEKDVLIEDLEGYELPEYERFKRVLAKEKIRIALLRMTIHSSEVSKHDSLQGQFNEVELLERNKESIGMKVLIKERKISECLVKIEKLKKKLNKQIERK